MIAGMLLASRDIIGGINWGLVGLFQFGLVTAGGLLGRRLKTQKWLNETVLSFVPGIIMLGLAFGRIAGI